MIHQASSPRSGRPSHSWLGTSLVSMRLVPPGAGVFFEKIETRMSRGGGGGGGGSPGGGGSGSQGSRPLGRARSQAHDHPVVACSAPTNCIRSRKSLSLSGRGVEQSRGGVARWESRPAGWLYFFPSFLPFFLPSFLSLQGGARTSAIMGRVERGSCPYYSYSSSGAFFSLPSLTKGNSASKRATGWPPQRIVDKLRRLATSFVIPEC